mmetsp:Transcript_121871/g.351862  ORF Transcript_121871/g.351862 Transcript_121871/m.351862 type:complete len:236 (+) Transcript_121871:1066-1773(+)
MPRLAAKRSMSMSAKFVGASPANASSCAPRGSGAKPNSPARNSNHKRMLVFVAWTFLLMKGSSMRRIGCSMFKLSTVTAWSAGASSKWILLKWMSNCVLAINVAMIAFSAKRHPRKLDNSRYFTSESFCAKSVNVSPAYSSLTVTNLPFLSCSVARPPSGAYPGRGSNRAKSERSTMKDIVLWSYVMCMERAVSDNNTPSASGWSLCAIIFSITGGAVAPLEANSTSFGPKKLKP